MLALPIALMRLSKSRWLSVPAYGYVFFFRGTPLLLQLFLVYYGLSQFEFIRNSFLWSFLRQAYWCAIITFAMHTAAYVAEIMRGAIQAVPKGHIEAARALGMSRILTFRRIVAPTAIRYGFPAYGNEVILMLKASALAQHHYPARPDGRGAHHCLAHLCRGRDVRACGDLLPSDDLPAGAGVQDHRKTPERASRPHAR